MTSFTPEARVIAAFTVAVALLLGAWHAAATLMTSLVGGPFGGLGGLEAALVGALTVVALAGAALWTARGAVAAAPQPWVVHLGQATVVLAALLMIAAVVGVLGSAVNSGYGYSFQ